jgi:hypothetical protein
MEFVSIGALVVFDLGVIIKIRNKNIIINKITAYSVFLSIWVFLYPLVSAHKNIQIDKKNTEYC